ncbi:hypothetical protein LCGC14_3046000, partial [marine sediment metagenome]
INERNPYFDLVAGVGIEHHDLLGMNQVS